ncbi:MAG: glutathione S-transferase family protein [Gammaproteobacteria bacterium]
MANDITLYSFVNRDRSCRPRWLLHELGLDYQEQRVDPEAGEHKSAAFREINPYGFIPALTIDGQAMGESGAICLYLADRFGYGTLAPKADDPLRADYLQWCFFGSCTLDEAFLPIVQPGRTPQDDLIANRAGMFGALTDQLAGGPYLLGEMFSVADILVAQPLLCAGVRDLLADQPEIQDYLGRLAERPAAQAAEFFVR